MHNKSGNDILQYWSDLRANAAAPLKSAIDPVALRQHLPHLFIVQGDGAGNVTFRLAGTAICDLFGMEIRGLGFAALWDAPTQAGAVKLCREVIVRERPAVMDVAAEALNQSCLYEMLLLPIRPEVGTSDRALGTLMPVGKTLPLSALPAKGLSLRQWRFIDDAGRAIPNRDTVGSIARSLKQKLESLPLSRWIS